MRSDSRVPPDAIVHDVFPFLQREEWVNLATSSKEVYNQVQGQQPPWPISISVGHPIFSIAISPADEARGEDEWLVCGCADGSIRTWNRRTLYSTVIPAHEAGVHQVVHCPSYDGYSLVSSSLDGKVGLWNDTKSNFPCRRVLEGMVKHDKKVALSEDGTRLALGYCLDNPRHDHYITNPHTNVEIWSIAGGESEASCIQHWSFGDDSRAGIESLAFSRQDSGRYLAASRMRDTTVYVWNLESSSSIDGEDGDGKENGDFNNGQEGGLYDSLPASAFTLKGHLGIIPALAWSPSRLTASAASSRASSRNNVAESSLLATASVDATIRLWSIPDGRCTIILGMRTTTTQIDQTDNESIHCIAFSPDGDLLASGHESGTIRLWDVRHGTCVSQLTPHSHYSTVMKVRSLTFTPDGKTIVSGGMDGVIHFWNVDTP